VARYRKKPVVIEAVQWTGSRESINAVCRWANVKLDEPVIDYTFTGADDVSDVQVWTLEGPLSASPGDFIIRGVKGEFYPCKPDIFEATYDPAGDA